jgi:hypothetical protein
MIDRISTLADAREDTLGRQLEEEHLPKRVRLPRKTRPAQSKGQ